MVQRGNPPRQRSVQNVWPGMEGAGAQEASRSGLAMAETILRPVLIATPCYGGQAFMNYVESILRLPPVVDFHFVKGESLITRARNSCVEYFLTGDWSNL